MHWRWEFFATVPVALSAALLLIHNIIYPTVFLVACLKCSRRSVHFYLIVLCNPLLIAQLVVVCCLGVNNFSCCWIFVSRMIFISSFRWEAPLKLLGFYVDPSWIWVNSTPSSSSYGLLNSSWPLCSGFK